MAAALPATGVAAHEFTAGADQYASFVEGASVPLSWPPALVCLVALGILTGLWHRLGARPLFIGFLPGIVLGIALSTFQPALADLAPHVAGLCVALLAASGLAPQRALGTAAGFVAGITVLLGALDEHPFGSLPVSIYVGICFATLLIAVATTALVRMSFDRWGEAKWLNIAWRTGASWCAAMLLLALAFELRPPV